MFSRKLSSKDGLRPACKECEKKRNASHYEKNKDKIKEQVKAWQKANPDKVNEYKNNFYHKNDPEAV